MRRSPFLRSLRRFGASGQICHAPVISATAVTPAPPLPTFHYAPSSSSSAAASPSATSTSIFTAAGQRLELQRLQNAHSAAAAALAERKGLYDAAHARVMRRADNMSALPVIYVAAQTALLFHWVYQKFDWGLVEPITYLLNFSCVWLGVGIYMRGGANFTYDDLRTRYEEKRMAVERARDPRIPTVDELEAAEAECDALARLLASSQKETF